MRTPEVINLNDAENLLYKVQNREVYLNTNTAEVIYALVLVVLDMLLSKVNK